MNSCGDFPFLVIQRIQWLHSANDMINKNLFHFTNHFSSICQNYFLFEAENEINAFHITIYDRIVASFKFSIVTIKAPMQEIRYNIKSF